MTSTINKPPAITTATLREATLAEVNAAKGNIFYQAGSLLWKSCCKAMGTAEIIWKGPNALTWQNWSIQKSGEKSAHEMGYYPEQPYVKRHYTFLSNDFYSFLKGDFINFINFDDEKIMDAYFKHHRNGKIFELPPVVTKILDALKDAFPEDTFTDEDLMFTCSALNTVEYRKLLHGIINTNNINQSRSDIQKTAISFIENWHKRCQKGEKINVTEETHLFTSSIITQIMFGTNKSSQKIADSFNFLNRYISKSLTGFPTSEEKIQYQEALKTFRGAVEEILKLEHIPIFDQKNTLTLTQKKAMIFMLYFGGQETTANLLTYMLWNLSINPEIQETLHKDPSQIDLYFEQAFNRFNPVYSLIRKLKTDVCMEYTVAGEDVPRKAIFFKGEYLVAKISVLAQKIREQKNREGQGSQIFNRNDHKGFGQGVHRCPGELLAMEEVRVFLSTLLGKYKITTNDKQPLSIVGAITAQLSKPVHITIEERK